jgi:hypothetical protein
MPPPPGPMPPPLAGGSAGSVTPRALGALLHLLMMLRAELLSFLGSFRGPHLGAICHLLVLRHELAAIDLFLGLNLSLFLGRLRIGCQCVPGRQWTKRLPMPIEPNVFRFMIYSCAGLAGADEHSHRNPVQWIGLIVQNDKCADGALPAADAKHSSRWASRRRTKNDQQACTACSGEAFVQALFTCG